ncbi:hypothetical protein [Methylomonas sp. Kb3]|uniref:hypothetical protein n=1 Tax=Methylomonas sp. Kb3 TaxID=1611544 RepID=UPI0010544D22|nr:hypothetical protein [Methylomonas sp. Kb3]
MHMTHSNSKLELINQLALTTPPYKNDALALAKRLIPRIQETIVSKTNENDGNKCIATYSAIVWTLNSYSFIGSFKNEQSAGNIVQNHCRSTSGVIPMWGQCGEFLLNVKGTQCIVKYTPSIVGSVEVNQVFTHFEFFATKQNQPFISETGYRSHFDKIHFGLTVDQAASSIFSNHLKEKKRPTLPKSVRQDIPSWWNSCLIPDGYELVEAILPKYKAFIAKKWAKEAAKYL